MMGETLCNTVPISQKVHGCYAENGAHEDQGLVLKTKEEAQEEEKERKKNQPQGEERGKVGVSVCLLCVLDEWGCGLFWWGLRAELFSIMANLLPIEKIQGKLGSYGCLILDKLFQSCVAFCPGT